MKQTLMALAASAVLCSSASAETIGVSMGTFDDNFLTLIRKSIISEAKVRPGVNVQIEDGQHDLNKQLSQIQNFIAQKVDAMIINAVDTDATPQMTKLATEAGIPLVYVNHMPVETQLPDKVAFVGSNEIDSGTLEMKEICKLIGGKGDIVVIMGELANQAARQRTQDVEDVISKEPCTGIKILGKQTANWDRTQAIDLMTNWLTSGMKPAAVVANNDEMAIGAIQALKQAGLAGGKIIVGGVDATQDGLGAMKDGDLQVTVFQNASAQGKGALDTALKLAKGEKIPDSMVWVPFELVTPANMNKYLNKK